MSERLRKLRQKLSELDLDALFVSQPENRRYLSGFTGSAGFLIISQESAILATDSRYVEQASQEALLFSIVQIGYDPSGWLPKVASDLGARRLGFEAATLPCASYRKLSETLSAIHQKARPRLLPTEGIVESLRAIKDEEELALIEKAAALTDSALEKAASEICAGMTEKQVA